MSVVTVERLASVESAVGAPRTPHVGARLAATLLAMAQARGRARQVRDAFRASRIPMTIVDSDRRYLEANLAARLLLRMSRSELRKHRIDDFIPSGHVPALEVAWSDLVDDGSAFGSAELRLADGSRLPIMYCRLANVLPGRHLSVFAPADWHEEELDAPEQDREPPLRGPLSRRQLEVLSLVATGADLQQIADELTISPATVRTHIANAHRKLGTRNRAHAVATALRRGIIDPPFSSSAGQ
jgi:DNA-binding CsgD family transcriptional regulator